MQLSDTSRAHESGFIAPDPAGKTSLILAALALACAALLAMQEHSSSRMLIWPWQLPYWIGPLAIGLALLARQFAPSPAASRTWRAWTLGLAAAGAGLVASTFASPFRDQILPWNSWPLAGLALVFLIAEHLKNSPRSAPSRQAILVGLGVFGIVLASGSLAMWASDLRQQFADRAAAGLPIENPWGHILSRRNAQPLGHPNYTAGITLLTLPALVALAWGGRGWSRAAWSLGVGLNLLMLFSGGSRGALLGLAAMALLALALAWRDGRIPRRWLALAILVALGLGLAHPGIRTGLLPTGPDRPANISNEERWHYIEAGARAFAERPVAGWGTGASPWIYPSYRGDFDYGPYSILQLHCTPIQLAAEGGLLVLAPFLLLFALTARSLVRAASAPRAKASDAAPPPPAFWQAAFAFVGYGAFSLTDYQFDLPAVVALCAIHAALIMANDDAPAPHRPIDSRITTGIRLVFIVALVALLGAAAWIAQHQLRLRHALENDDWVAAARIAPDDAALRVYVADRLLLAAANAGSDREKPAAYINEAARLLTQNTRRQLIEELTQTRLGWLLLGAHPEQALEHFARAIAVAPDHASARLGSALAALGLNQTERATEELVVVCLIRPRFISSGWWRTTNLAPLRAAVVERLRARLLALSQDDELRAPERQTARYIDALLAWLADESRTLDGVADQAAGWRRDFWLLLQSPGHTPTQPLPIGPLAALDPLISKPDDDSAPRWRSALELILRQPITDQYAVEQGLINNLAPASLIRSALRPDLDSPWPYHGRHNARAGFQINHRHPRLQGVNDGMPQIENLWADHFLSPLWPETTWLPNRKLGP